MQLRGLGLFVFLEDETARFIGECIFHGIIEFDASVSQPSFNSLKPNRLESRRKSMATHLRGLATTCVGLLELKFVRKSTQVFHRSATQRRHKLIAKSTVYA